MAKDEGESSLNSTTKVKKEKRKLFYLLGNQGSREKLFYKNCSKLFLISSLLVN